MTISPAPAGPMVGLEAKLAFLRSPAAYLASAGTVDVRETHMSWVFLAGERVCKLKKPVRYPFLDYSTPERRRAFCEEEVRLNRRLAPDIYLGAPALTQEADGSLRIGGAGTPVDWLVAMRRLPAARMLDAALAAGTATVAEVTRAADHLAAFYARAAAEPPPEAAYLGRFGRELAADRAVLEDPAFAMPDGMSARVLAALGDFLRTGRAMLLARLQAGRIVEGHGDLRPEHVFLGEPPAVIDCLEFDRALRLLDPFEELAFLSLECALLGGAWAGDIFVRRCAAALGEAPPEPLFDFYTASRACLRSRLCLAHLQEPDPREPGKWLPKARRYLEVATAACDRLSLPAVR